MKAVAKRRKRLQPGGPYIGCAVLCEKVLQERDNVVSLIRIVDRTIISGRGPDAPEELPSFPLTQTVFVALKSGLARGKYIIAIQAHSPSGRPVGEPIQVPALFEGDERGVNVIASVTLQVEEEGLYWFDVSVEGQSLTRIPLRVLYQRTGMTM